MLHIYFGVILASLIAKLFEVVGFSFEMLTFPLKSFFERVNGISKFCLI